MVTKFRKKKKRNAQRNIFFSILLTVFVLLIVGFFAFTNWKINKRRAKLIDRISDLNQEIQILEQRNKELKEKKAEAQSEDYLEKVAREQLDLKKPGEEVVVVQKEQEEQEEIEEEKKTWWERIKSIWTRD